MLLFLSIERYNYNTGISFNNRRLIGMIENFHKTIGKIGLLVHYSRYFAYFNRSERSRFMTLPYNFTAFILFLTLAVSGIQNVHAQDDEENKLPPAEDITLTTKDGVVLHCSWYPGVNEKETVPIILLHGWEEDRHVYKDYALFLQQKHGHAVIVPDLRGHGESTELANGMELDLKRFGKA